jgi:DNA-binding beta-propeller fold protein YncE
MGTYSDGSLKAIPASSVAWSWSSTDTGSVSINPNGLATPISKGTITISASTGGITVLIALTITPTDIFTIWSTSVKPVDPVGVAVDSSGNVYVADAAFSNNSSMIHKYNATGKQIASFNVSITNNVVGVAFDNISSNVYVTDYDNNSLNKYNSAGTLTATTPPTGTLRAPTGVAVDSFGNIYVTDAKNNYLHKYNSSLVEVSPWPVSTVGVPSGVAVDLSGNVYVADLSESKIRTYSAAGAPITSWSTTGTPFGVAVDPTGKIVYVIDTYYYMLREYDTSGNSLNGPWSTSGWPNAVAVDPSGNVYVVDASYNVVRIYKP